MGKPAKWKVGDIVTIDNPEIFIRCGYPLSKEEALAKVFEIARDDIGALLKKLGSGWIGCFSMDPEICSEDTSRATKKVLDALAYAYTEYAGFGGKERRIHTKLNEGLRGKQATVRGWQFKATGDYYAPSSYPGSYWEPAEYEPGGLANQSRHRILEVLPFGKFESIQIEECHVSKVAVEAQKEAA